MNWCGHFSKSLLWEEHRKSKFFHAIAGLASGLLMFLAVAPTIAIAWISENNAPLRSVGAIFAIWALVLLTIMGLLTLYFGYKDIKYVTKRILFRWCFAGGFSTGIIIFIIGYLSNPV